MEKPTKSIDSLKEQEVEGENVKGGKSSSKASDANAPVLGSKDQKSEFEQSLPFSPVRDSRVPTNDPGNI